MRTVLNRLKNPISDFYFSSSDRFCYRKITKKRFIEKKSTKMTISQKIKSENWFFIQFSTSRIFHENGSKTDGEGGDRAGVLLGTGQKFETIFQSPVRIQVYTGIKSSQKFRFSSLYSCHLLADYLLINLKIKLKNK